MIKIKNITCPVYDSEQQKGFHILLLFWIPIVRV